MNNKYRKKIDNNYNQNIAHKIRWNKTLNFLKHHEHEPSLGLDIGNRSNLTAMIEEFYGINFKNTNIDLDTEKLNGSYDIITSFEVIEHLFNPLFNLLEMNKVLRQDGVLYLSTPLQKPHFLWSPNHFHEMSQESVQNLLTRAGFKIVRNTTFKIRPMSFYLTGIKPAIRFFFEKIQIFELKKIN